MWSVDGTTERTRERPDCLRSRSRERLREEPPRDRERRDRRLIVGEAERRREREHERGRESGDPDRVQCYWGENWAKGEAVVSMK